MFQSFPSQMSVLIAVRLVVPQTAVFWGKKVFGCFRAFFLGREKYE